MIEIFLLQNLHWAWDASLTRTQSAENCHSDHSSPWPLPQPLAWCLSRGSVREEELWVTWLSRPCKAGIFTSDAGAWTVQTGRGDGCKVGDSKKKPEPRSMSWNPWGQTKPVHLLWPLTLWVWVSCGSQGPGKWQRVWLHPHKNFTLTVNTKEKEFWGM